MTLTVSDYAPLDDPNLLNPERGIYHDFEGGIKTDPHTLVTHWLHLDTHCDKDLVWKGYADPDTSQVLKEYASELLKHRAAGQKVIFRPRYDTPKSEPNSCTGFEADTEARMRDHVDAVAAMLADFKDVVAFIQAGYLGHYGEWNTDKFKPETSPTLNDPAKRRAFLAYVIDAYRKKGLNRHVGVRRPIFAKEMFDNYPQQSPFIGFYNDCFMSSDNDADTYANYEAQNPSNFPDAAKAIEWLKAASRNVPFGGETCPVGARRYKKCKNMVGQQSEPAGLHMTYLNVDWANDAMSSWVQGKCYGEIQSRLGYRFEVASVDYTEQATAGTPVTVRVRVRNTGWARMYNPRSAYVILKGGNARFAVGGQVPGYQALAATHTTGGEVRDWLSGEESVFEQTFIAPPGTWEVGVMLPDPDRPDVIRYAVRFASTRKKKPLYDEATGVNMLGVTLTVK